MTKTTHRLLHITALLSLLAVVIALISQHVFGLRPCAWCVLQRLVYVCITVVCWVAILFERIGLVRRLAAIVVFVLSLAGIKAAWYQYDVAAHMFSCAQSFADKFIAGLGLDAHLPWLFGIYASCMDAQVKILGVEFAIWSLSLFCLLGLFSLIVLLRCD
jgi:disulfide bond formation protein DsbB